MCDWSVDDIKKILLFLKPGEEHPPTLSLSGCTGNTPPESLSKVIETARTELLRFQPPQFASSSSSRHYLPATADDYNRFAQGEKNKKLKKNDL
jgi:hypothetical protein